MKNEKQNIKVAAYDLHNYYARSDYSEALEYLVSVQDMVSLTKRFLLQYTAGNVVLSTEIDHIGSAAFSSESDDLETTVFSRQYFQKAMKGETFVSDIAGSVIPIKNEEGQLELGMPTMFISTPILSADAHVLGVLVFRIDIEQINTLIFRLNATKSGDIYLINKDGYMLTESRFTDALELGGHIEKRTSLELRVVNPVTNNLTLAAMYHQW